MYVIERRVWGWWVPWGWARTFAGACARMQAIGAPVRVRCPSERKGAHVPTVRGRRMPYVPR